MGEIGLQFIPSENNPDNMTTVRGIVDLLNTRYPEDKLVEREGPGGKKLKYVAWDDSLAVMNRLFGQVYWGEGEASEAYDPTSRTYRVTKTISAAAYDPIGKFIVIFTKVGKGRAVARNDSADAHDLAASAADSDAFSRACKKLGNAFAAYLYDAADPARQEHRANPTTRSSGGYTASSTTAASRSSGQSYNGNGRGKPTANMVASLNRNGVPQDIINRVSFEEAGKMIGTFKSGGDLDAAMNAAGLLEPAGVAEDHYLDSRGDDYDDIPF